jgi:gas vesicle protein
MRRFFSFLSGVLSGATVGAAVALLMAPMSGEELLTEVQSRADKLLGDVKATIQEERGRLEAELEALKRGEIQVS